MRNGLSPVGRELESVAVAHAQRVLVMVVVVVLVDRCAERRRRGANCESWLRVSFIIYLGHLKRRLFELSSLIIACVTQMSWA